MDELLAFLREEEGRSRNEDLVLRAETALKSYNGDEYGDEEDGRSRVVTRDVAEVVDQMQISVLRQFVSGDRVVEFEPLSSDDEQAADDATEAITRQFSRKGYRLLHDWFKEGNLCTLGVVKTVAESKKIRTEVLTADPEADGAIEADSMGIDPMAGVEVFRAVVLQDGPVEFKDYLVPLEEFRVSPDARELDEAAYLAHATHKTVSELVEMGFAKEDVEDLQAEISLEQMSFERDDRTLWSDERKGANRKVLLLEEYVRFDLNGDGIAERLCVHRVGDHILKAEEVDYHPFVEYCPFPMPGRLVGHALAEKVIDIQRINSVLNRLALDGLYNNLSPGKLVHEDSISENTLDDLLTIRPNRIVRWKGAVPPVSEDKSDVSSIAWQAMEFMIGQRESRTGITRLNQGLDADTLNKTATGTALMQAQGQQMEEYLARNYAESVSRLMVKKKEMMRKYGEPFEIRVDGQFRQVDPSQWPDEMDVITRVGLGSGKKEHRLANRMNVLQIQREMMLGGAPNITWDHIWNSLAGVVKDSSIGSPNDFADDPSSPEVQERMAQPQPPSPEEQKLQADIEAKKFELQMKHQQGQANLQLKLMEIQAKIGLAREDAEAKLLLEQQKAFVEAQLAQQQQMFEAQLERMKISLQAQAHEREANRSDAEAGARIKNMRAGGSLAK